MKKIAVLGAGTMGVGISCDLLSKRFEVLLVDNNPKVLHNAKKEIYRLLCYIQIFNKNKVLVDLHDNLILNVSSKLDSVSDCDYIIENISEKIELKTALYEKLDKILNTKTVIAANTSCIPISELAENLSKPERLIGIHFMNPAYLKDTVEVILSKYTSRETFNYTESFLDKLGKKLVVVNDSPGFVSNRISHLFMNEAAAVLQDGIADAKGIDNIFRNCFGHKMGPLETADLIGIDVVVDSLNVLYNHFKDSKYKCCPLLIKMVKENKLGRKAKQGFYKY